MKRVKPGHRPDPDALGRWLADIEGRHPVAIDLGLDRVGRVWHALGAPRPARWVLTIGGTNGKGSTVAFAEAAARALGWRVGAYTSPHIQRYNERIRIDGNEAADDAIVECFQRIERARGEISLTYFEFGTLAAFLLMAQATPRLDLAILEVGLGGRLDAVNLIDADVSVVTTIALDHRDWLGDSRAAIAVEKAGIARPGRPLIVGERDAEPALLAAAIAIGADVRRLGGAFDWRAAGDRRVFVYDALEAIDLPRQLPLVAPCQWDNAATALAALSALAEVMPASLARSRSGDKAKAADPMRADRARETDAHPTPDFDPAMAAAGLRDAILSGRLQRLADSPEVVVDVGHNPQAAEVLAQWLAGAGAGRTTDVVFSALSDKDIEGIVLPLLPRVRCWHVAGLADLSPRGLTSQALAKRVASIARPDADSAPTRIVIHASIADALAAALAGVAPDERVLAFGSFHVVAEAGKSLRWGL